MTEQDMTPEDEARLRKKFHTNATIAVAGQCLQKPELRITDESHKIDAKTMKRVKETQPIGLMEYVGRNTKLKGRVARVAAESKGRVRAQFVDEDLGRELTLQWYWFKKDEFTPAIEIVCNNCRWAGLPTDTIRSMESDMCCPRCGWGIKDPSKSEAPWAKHVKPGMTMEEIQGLIADDDDASEEDAPRSECGNCDGTGSLCGECMLPVTRCTCMDFPGRPLTCDGCNGSGDKT